MRIVLAWIIVLASVTPAQVPLPTAPTWMSSETNLFGTGLDIGDIDGDGWLDLAVSNGNDMALAPNLVYISADGTLPTAASWASQDARYSGHCQLADLDGDGLPELMVANYITAGWGPAQVQVYRNRDGALETTPSWESPADIHSFRASFGDPDQDGDLDLAVATGEAYNDLLESNLIFFNVDGALQSAPGWTSTVHDACYDIRFVDIDNDGDQDLATLGGGQGRVMIYLNDAGVLATSPAWATADVDNGNTFDFDDLDGDGRLDLVMGANTQLGGTGRFQVYLTAGGELANTPTWTSDFQGYGSAVVCADLDGTGGPDLVTGGWWQPVRVYLNDGAGGFTGEPQWQSGAAWASVVEAFGLADLDERRSCVEAATFPAGSRLLALPHRHLQAVTAVTVGDTVVPPGEFCASRADGWVSLAAPAAAPVQVTYRVSDEPDLAVSNWDDATFVFANLRLTAAPEPTPDAVLTDVRAWPNPFNPQTTIGFRLDRDAPSVRVKFYDLRGRLVDALAAGARSAGPHRLDWRPRALASGVYLYRIEAAGETVSGKVVLAR